MTTYFQEKPSSRITSSGAHRFKLFGKPGSFGVLSKLGWTNSKRRRATGKRILSILTCCTLTDKPSQDTSGHQVHCQPIPAQRANSNNPTPSQTVTYSTATTTSLSLKDTSIYDNTSTDKRPCDTDKDRVSDHGISTAMIGNIDHQQMDDHNTPSSQLPLDITSIPELHHHSEILVQKGINHMDHNEDTQETTTPSLDSEQDLWLLAPISEQNKGRKCLVLDLDETLVHSSFKPTSHANIVVPVEIDGSYHNVFVLKRPGVDTFMKRMGELYEIVVFTASLSKYADPVLDMFDIHHVVQHRLFRESCFYHKGTYVKDLSQLGRELNQVIILDNSPASYIFHTTSAIPVSSWYSDPHDSELVDLIPFLEDLVTVDDVTDVLDNALPGPFSHF